MGFILASGMATAQFSLGIGVDPMRIFDRIYSAMAPLTSTIISSPEKIHTHKPLPGTLSRGNRDFYPHPHPHLQSIFCICLETLIEGKICNIFYFYVLCHYKDDMNRFCVCISYKN